MSETYNEHRNVVCLHRPHKGKYGIVGKKVRRTKRKLKPLLAGKRSNYDKLTYSDGLDVPFCYKTKSMKLELKNANRSVKKSDRQKSKIDIKKQLQNL